MRPQRNARSGGEGFFRDPGDCGVIARARNTQGVEYPGRQEELGDVRGLSVMYRTPEGKIECPSICFDLCYNAFRGGMAFYHAPPVGTIHNAGGPEGVAAALVEEIIGPEFHLLDGSSSRCRQ